MDICFQCQKLKTYGRPFAITDANYHEILSNTNNSNFASLETFSNKTEKYCALAHTKHQAYNEYNRQKVHRLLLPIKPPLLFLTLVPLISINQKEKKKLSDNPNARQFSQTKNQTLLYNLHPHK